MVLRFKLCLFFGLSALEFEVEFSFRGVECNTPSWNLKDIQKFEEKTDKKVIAEEDLMKKS